MSSMTCSVKSDSAVGGSWECPSCSYRNADRWNPKCSMCGTVLQEEEEGLDEQPHDDDNCEANITSPSNVVLVTRSSSLTSSDKPRRRSIFKKEKDKSMSLGSLLQDICEKDEESHSRPTSSPPSKLAAKQAAAGGCWTCDACTFVNSNPLHLACEVCSTKKPKDAALANSNASIRELFNSRASFSLSTSSSSASVKEQLAALQAFEERTLKKEQMDEIIEHQRRLIAEFSSSQAALSALNENKAETAYVDDETLRRTRMEMQKSSGDLLEMEQLHFAEKEEQEAMEEFLKRRKIEIEAEEDIVLSEEVKPGAQSVSPQEHQWKAQMRMLRQWRHQWNLRDEELRQIRELHLMATGSS